MPAPGPLAAPPAPAAGRRGVLRRGASLLRRALLDPALYSRPMAPLSRAVLGEPEGAAVLLYHRVCDPDAVPFLGRSDISSIPPRRFARHLACMRDLGAEPLTVAEVGERLAAGAPLPARSVAVCFDDTLREHAGAALAALAAAGVRATFFVITDLVGAERLHWQHRLYWYVHHHGPRRVVDGLRRVDREASRAEGGVAGGRDAAAGLAAFLRETPGRKEQMLAAYQAAEGSIPDEAALARELYPTPDDLRRLHAAGMEVASHSRGHHFMAGLPDELYRAELHESRRALESWLDAPVTSFSYPHNSHRPDRELVEGSGYRVACTVDEGRVTARSSPFKLPRLAVRNRELALATLRRRLLT